MKKAKALKSLFYLMTTGLVSLFVAQSSLANVAVWQPLAMNPAFQGVHITSPGVVPSMINTLVFPETKNIESKQIWVGKEGLMFHVWARESLQTKTIPFIKEDLPYMEGIKKLMLRVALQILIQDNVALPLKSNLLAASLIRRSA